MQKEINGIIEDIFQYLKENESQKYDLFKGKLGISLFFFYYSFYAKNKNSFDIAFHYLEDEKNRFDNGIGDENLIFDIQWFVWALNILKNDKIIECDLNDFDSIFPLLSNRFNHNDKIGNYDLIYGNIGLGLVQKYFLSTEKYVELFYNFFNNNKEEHVNSVTWKWLDKNTNSYGYNFGLAHGIPSIIIFLNKLFSLRKKTTILKLIDDSCRYLMSNIQNPVLFNSYFPTSKTVASTNTFGRLAWCYGDLGCGYALLKSSMSLNNKPLFNKSIQILKHTAQRRDPELTLIKDLGICHGSSGLIIFFDKLFELTNEEVFHEAYTYWLNYTINEIISKGDVSNILAWNSLEAEGSHMDKGFLTGLAGIGLVLITTISKNEKSWNEFLLLD